jgi:hypothetical protein
MGRAAVADDGQTSLEAFADGLSTSHDTDPVTGRLTHVSTGSGATVPAADGGRAFQNTIQTRERIRQLEAKALRKLQHRDNPGRLRRRRRYGDVQYQRSR